MQVINLFPVPVGIFNFERDFSDTEIEYIKNLDKKPNMGNLVSIEDKCLREEKLKDIKEFVEKSFSQYFTEMYSPKNKELHLRLTQSWFNYTDKGQFHHKHSHSNSFISGVLYIQSEDDLDKIYFYNDRLENQQLQIPVDVYNLYNSESWWMPSNTKTLYLFPSWLKHSVETVQANKTRISLAFNTFPVGSLGLAETLTELVV